jgi:transcriptional regulator GlxA family with amidase domain
MEIAILLYDRFTALDAVGPFQVLALLPGAKVKWVAAEARLIRSDSRPGMMADYTLDDVTRPEVVVVPGGTDVRPAMKDERVLSWLRAVHATTTWTTSVCTGSLILGAAGILRGLNATTHWSALDALRDLGATPVRERVVRDGKVVTGAGVSAGIDMALRLAETIAGTEVAQAIQLVIEYDPDPPYACGSPAKAPAAVMQRAGRLLSPPSKPPHDSRAVANEEPGVRS